MAMIFRCDRCGRPNLRGDVKKSGTFVLYEEGLGPEGISFELCTDCFTRFREFRLGKAVPSVVTDTLGAST